MAASEFGLSISQLRKLVESRVEDAQFEAEFKAVGGVAGICDGE